MMMMISRRKKRSSSYSESNSNSNSNELQAVKAAAWAWYQHGSGSCSEGKPTLEFDACRMIIRRDQPLPSMPPSRYKLEATRNKHKEMKMKMKMEQGSSSSSSPSRSARTTSISLLDSYEIESISNRLNHLIESSTIGTHQCYEDYLLSIHGEYVYNNNYQKNLASDDDHKNIDSAAKAKAKAKAVVVGAGPKKKKKKKEKSSNKLKGLFQLRHAAICGRSQDVVDGRALRPVRSGTGTIRSDN